MHETVGFPVSTPLMIVWAICLGVAAYFFVSLLKYLLRKNRRGLLVLCFGMLLAMGTAVHVVLLSLSSHTVTDGNWIQLVLVSLVAGLEMFIGHTVVFDDIIAAVIFRMPGLLLAYLTIFILVLSFSFVLVFQILPRRLRDRIWLFRHRRQASADRKNHIFIGVTPQAKLLAKSILKDWEPEKRRNDQGQVMFIDLPDKEGVHAEISFGDIFTSLVSRRKELGLDEELGTDRFVLFKDQHPFGDRDKDLVDAIGLRRLRPWFRNERSSIYILGDEADNTRLLDLLLADSGVKAKVFCLTDRVNDTHSFYSSVRGRVHMIDTHLLAVQQIKFQKPDLHPVHFVEMAKGPDGEPLGYVASGFHAMLAGFRETGQESLRFLYEFGSFVGKDRKRAPTTFDIFDDDQDRHRGDFLNRYPGLRDDDAIVWNGGPIGGDRFWQRYAEILDGLNYAVVATGNLDRNIEIAARMLQTAARSGKDMSRFVILVRLVRLDDRIRGILDFYNRTYHPGGAPVLRPFGVAEDIWTLATISGKGMKERASRFYAAFQHAICGEDTWETRRERLTSRCGDPVAHSMELMRRQGQDLSCSAFMPTLRVLAGEKLGEAASRIPNVFEHGRHYPDKGPDFVHLEYLAIQSHLRWTASHLAAGYVQGERDELLMRIPDLKPYDEVADTKVEHFDWIAVKTALAEETTAS